MELFNILKPLYEKNNCKLPIEIVLYIEKIIYKNNIYIMFIKAQKHLNERFIRYPRDFNYFKTTDNKIFISKLGKILNV